MIRQEMYSTRGQTAMFRVVVKKYRRTAAVNWWHCGASSFVAIVDLEDLRDKVRQWLEWNQHRDWDSDDHCGYVTGLQHRDAEILQVLIFTHLQMAFR